MVYRLRLNDGSFAEIDDIDLTAVHTVHFSPSLRWTGQIFRHLWRAHRDAKPDGVVCDLPGGLRLFLAHAILDAPAAERITHLDGNDRNNRRENLRRLVRAPLRTVLRPGHVLQPG